MMVGIKPASARRGPRTRQHVLAAIDAYPGLHLEALSHMTRTSAPLVQHHVRALLSEHRLVAEKTGRSPRYFPLNVSPSKRAKLALLREPLPFAIALSLIHHGETHHARIARDVQFARSTISYHLRKLVDRGIVRHDRERQTYVLLHRFDVELLLRSHPPPKPLLEGFGDLWGRFLRGEKAFRPEGRR